MTPSVLRPIRIVSFAFLGAIVIGLIVSALLTLREGRRLAHEQEVLGQINEFHRVHLLVTQRLIQLETGHDADRGEIADQLDHLKALALDPGTRERLGEVNRSIQERRGPLLVETLVAFQQIAVQERSSEAALLQQLQRDTQAHLQMEIAIPLSLIALGLVLYPYARRRILKPLEAFGRELSRVGEGDFSATPTSDVDPLILPLHRRLNDLVGRLRQLEAEHEARADTLEAEVRTATRALLEQQRSLARAERLAATGELAATVAHELRNPLAGIQMTLHNLRAEVGDADLSQRVDRVAQEVERLTRLLNQILDASRHSPEVPREVAVADLVGDLLDLTRHQLPPQIALENQVDPELVCRLPADQLRQALLNLVLNAAAALGEAGVIIIAAEREGDRIRIDVLDDGPGFPAEVLDGGIRPFFSTRETGTGLGLAVARRFARDASGEIQLANRAPHGARVTLLLPCQVDDG